MSVLGFFDSLFSSINFLGLLVGGVNGSMLKFSE